MRASARTHTHTQGSVYRNSTPVITRVIQVLPRIVFSLSRFYLHGYDYCIMYRHQQLLTQFTTQTKILLARNSFPSESIFIQRAINIFRYYSSLPLKVQTHQCGVSKALVLATFTNVQFRNWCENEY
jgi:hypothetical protein